MAFYLQEPWAAVRKMRLFDQDFRRIFSRKIDAYHVYLLYLIDEAVKTARSELRDDLAASFASVRFTLVYLVGCLLEANEPGRQLKDAPDRWILDQEVHNETVRNIRIVAREAIGCVNDYVETQLADDEDFDPKIIFKSKAGVAGVKTDTLRIAKVLDRRGAGFYFTVSPIAA